jgi:glutaredoxin-related protein
MRAISLTKTYKCKVCKEPFTKERLTQKICGQTACIVEQVYKNKAKREKVERKETKAKLKVLTETKPKLTKAAQTAFNAYIRYRDIGKPCISCNSPIKWDGEATGGACDAGHWLSVGARVNLRFNEDNCHAQCKHCNNQLSGNAANYRIGLVKRIGLERVEALECDHKLNHYTKDDLRAIEATYKAKLQHLKAFNDMVKLTEEMGLYEAI